MKAAIELEMAYTSWADSCQAGFNHTERCCRRQKGHSGSHASGFGGEYLSWITIAK